MNEIYEQLLKDFYIVINKIIHNIINNNEINNNLNYCNYDIYYAQNKKLNINHINLPKIICLGGMGYKIYSELLKKYTETKYISKTKDYDISFSLQKYDEDFIKHTKIIIKNYFIFFVKDFNKEYDYLNKQHKIKKEKITEDNFHFKSIEKIDRLQIQIECELSNKYKFHILELSFWYNGKVSDEFTINDFKKKNLFLYTDKNNSYYYLLPLNLLVKTTYYAILDNFEKNNFEKCVKYLERIKYIKKVYDDIKKIEYPLINYLFGNYVSEIYKKYKIMFDYPYILCFNLILIKDKKILKCIYRKLRTNNFKTIENLINNYEQICLEKENIMNENELTDVDTETL